MEIQGAINPVIEKYINDISKPIDRIWYNEEIETLIKPIREDAINILLN